MDPITLAGGISLSLLDRKPVVNAICGCCGTPGHLSEALIGTPVACPLPAFSNLRRCSQSSPGGGSDPAGSP